MKKFLFATLVSVLFASCAVTDYPVVIRNDSAKTVTFNYNDAKDIAIAPGGSDTYTVRAHTPAPEKISVPGAQSVKMSSSSDGYVFEDRESLALTVTNTLSHAVIVTAGEWLEDVAGTKTEITIGAGKTESNAKIYTRIPGFVITAENTGKPVQFEKKIDTNTTPNTMNVTVK